MPKPWEIKLTKDPLGRFKRILSDLKYGGVSSVCPFDSDSCNRRRPTCTDFVEGLKGINYRQTCPCHKFRTASLIWRIEALLKYNENKKMK